MKKVNLTTNALFLLLTFSLFVGCSKDDDANNDGETGIITPSEVNQLEFVTIQMPNAVTSEEYTGTFNETLINIIAIDDNNLAFVVPSTVIGESTLTIDGLELSLNYNVQETVLSSTPDEEMSTFFDITT